MLHSAKLLAGAVLAVAVACAPALAQEELVTLNDNDGIYVSKDTFKVVKGNGAKANPAATLKRMGAKEVSANAIIYRSGGKLYIVDAAMPPKMPPQYSRTLEEWCP